MILFDLQTYYEKKNYLNLQKHFNFFFHYFLMVKFSFLLSYYNCWKNYYHNYEKHYNHLIHFLCYKVNKYLQHHLIIDPYLYQKLEAY